MSVMKTSPGPSLTFIRPPLDGSLTYPEIFDYNAQHSPDHPVFQFYEQDHIQKITWSEVTKAIHAAGRVVRDHVTRTDYMDSAPIVGVLANADSITFLTVVSGIIRAGYTAFPISTRNSPAAIAHLLGSTRCKYLFVNADSAMQEIAHLQDGIKLIPMPTFEDLYLKNDSEPLPYVPDWKQIALIIHSSGSTRLGPSPIAYSHRNYMMHGVWLSYGDMDVCGHVLSAHASAMYHLMGCWTFMVAASDGVTIAVFPPENPPIVPTPQRVLEGIIATNCTIVFCVPHFFETWVHDPAAVEVLTKATVVLFGGAPLAKAAGDSLVAKGVTLCTLFGSTETTFTAKMIPKETPAEGWEWFEWAHYIDYILLPIEGEENMFYVIIKENPNTGYSPAVFNTTIDGVRANDTKDIFIRHPTNPEMFKCYGRYDDQIIHSSGEKTNPMPIEKTITTDKRIAVAVMFGQLRIQSGVLVSPAPEHEFDPANEKDLADFRASIWGTVSKANNEAPQHSRISKEMIIITHPSKPFTFTPKGTLRRPAILKAYSREIEAAYEAVDKISLYNIPAP